MYKIRQINSDDYQVLTEWWKDWDWQPVPEVFLSPTGLMVYNDIDICAGWIYKTDTPICWIENVISNKNAKDRDAVTFLLQALEAKARTMGFKVAMTSVKNKSLIRKMENIGYIKTDTDMTNYVRAL